MSMAHLLSLLNVLPLPSPILHFQYDANQAGQRDDSQTKRGPRKQKTLRGIRLAINRVKRAVIGVIIAEELAAVDLVAVQTQRRAEGNHRPARREQRSSYQCNPILQRDHRAGKDHLEDDHGREQAVSSVVIGRDGGNCQAKQNASHRRERERDIDFEQYRQEDALVERLKGIDDKKDRGTL